MVEAAKSGHPGAPLGQAPLAYWLWTRHLRFDPAAPDWPDRDRFVLSCGHASALLYGLLHLAGYDLPLAELERFRQLGSKTPGHPELGLTPRGRDHDRPARPGARQRRRDGDRAAPCSPPASTGPACRCSTHRIWVIASDGDLMEGDRQRGRRRSPATCGWAASRSSTTTTASRSTARPTSRSPRTSSAVSRAYGWHIARGRGRQRSRRPRPACSMRPPPRRRAADAGAWCARTSATAARKQDTRRGPRLAARRRGRPGHRRARSAGPRTPASSSPRQARGPFREAAAQRRRGARRAGASAWRAIATTHAELAAELERRLARRLPEGWSEALPRLRRGRTRWPPGRRRAKCSTPWPRGSPSSSAARRT